MLWKPYKTIMFLSVENRDKTDITLLETYNSKMIYAPTVLTTAIENVPLVG